MSNRSREPDRKPEMSKGVKRIEKMFRGLRREKRCGFIAYVTCGHPRLASTIEIARALEEAGADAIELGVPFSDPIADGQVIQSSSQKSLEKGTTLDDCIEIARAIRMESSIPLILFSYFNPLLSYGAERLAERCEEAGIDAVLVTDLPPEDAGELLKPLRKRGIGVVFLATPVTTKRRLKKIDKASEGFVYFVSTTGVTGARSDLDQGLAAKLDATRKAIDNPLVVGFGVSKPEHYESLRDHCDAVVVGSAIVRAIDEGSVSGAPERAAAVVREILGREVHNS